MGVVVKLRSFQTALNGGGSGHVTSKQRDPGVQWIGGCVNVVAWRKSVPAWSYIPA